MLYILRLWAQLARRATDVCLVCDIASTPLCGPFSHQQGPGRARAPGGQCRGRAGSDCGTTSLQRSRGAPAQAAPPTLPRTGAPAGSPHQFTAASGLSSHTRMLAAIRHGRGAGSALTSQAPAGVLESHAHTEGRMTAATEALQGHALPLGHALSTLQGRQRRGHAHLFRQLCARSGKGGRRLARVEAARGQRVQHGVRALAVLPQQRHLRRSCQINSQPRRNHPSCMPVQLKSHLLLQPVAARHIFISRSCEGGHSRQQ